MIDSPTTRLPGISTGDSFAYRTVTNPTVLPDMAIPGGVILASGKSRDPGNTGYTAFVRAGNLLGRRTSDGKWATSVLGVTTAAYSDNGTTLTVSPAVAAEIVRRIGATGTLKLVGPPTAGGTVAIKSVAYTAVNTTTGAITVPDLNADFIAGSLVMPADGSETIKAVMGTGDGVRVVDANANDLEVTLPVKSVCQPLIGGYVQTAGIVNYPADSALKAWVKAQLRAVGVWLFDDDV